MEAGAGAVIAKSDFKSLANAVGSVEHQTGGLSLAFLGGELPQRRDFP